MKRFLSTFIVFLALFQAFSQSAKITYSGNCGYTLVERTNLRRYDNGKYTGLTSREVRSFIAPGSSPSSARKNPAQAKAQWYDGHFYVQEETLRSTKSVATGIHQEIASVFYIDSDGQMTMFQDNGYPAFRSFPSYTSQSLVPGDTWKAQAERAVDPLNKGVFTRMPIQVLYTFKGEENYKGEDVYRIEAMWQTNYGFSNLDRDFRGDSSLLKAMGGHKADIIVRKATGEAILIVDKVDETYHYNDGNQINFKGTITLFTEYPPAVDRSRLLPFLNRVATVKDGTAAGASFSSKGGTVSGSTASAKAGKAAAAAKNSEGKPSDSGKKADGGNSGSKSGKNSSQSSSAPAKNNLLVEQTEAGLRLSIRDIKFQPDSAQVLASESSRLDEIAAALKLAGENMLLVEGHTASIGKPAGEMQLSVQRAESVAGELAKRGIKATRFICKGWGGNKPVADNSTEEGRAQNRRVEITILE